ncbi:hypothetical protein [Microtetraspora glauca]|uniref:FtsK domain-containing protein n=1 Tax=Microtetraspora glauca TaxID=1996 RepID=A0ABV3GAZ5_MICGL
MASTRTAAVPAVPDVTDTSMERLAARAVSKVMLYATPWFVGVLVFGLGVALYYTLGGTTEWVAWSAVLTTMGVLVLTGVTYGQSHARGPWGKAHTTLSTFLAGMWVVACVIAGPGHPLIWRLGVIGGITVALTWDIRTAIRRKGWDAPGVIHDKLGFLFDQAHAMPGAKMKTVEQGDAKIKAKLELPAGEKIAEDAQKKAPYMESGMHLPPGSLTVTVDPDDASRADVVLSDPRVMKKPIPWPGPAWPGGSIADPLRVGVWQDLDVVEYCILGHHLQLMGMTGAGKSIGGCWNILGEAITRTDVAVFAADVTKGTQTLGPLAPALHRLETTPEGARAMLRDLQSKVKERTSQLAAKGLQKWKPGCGLAYWVIWLEECPDIFDTMSDKEMESFLSLAKALRSGGGSIFLSLQRSDYTQMPTIARGQLGNMCFGVQSSSDAAFGLSEAMQDAGARPELWENGQPGMAYLGAPTIARERIAMPLRTYAWGMKDGDFDDERASAAMREHAAKWPAAAKKVDTTTAALSQVSSSPAAGTTEPGEDQEEDEEVKNVSTEYLETDDPDPTVQADADDEIEELPEGDPPWEFAPPGRRMTAEERGAALMARLQELWDEGAREFSSGDFKPLWESTDISRAWIQKQLKKLDAAGVLGGYDDERQMYLMPERPELP